MPKTPPASVTPGGSIGLGRRPVADATSTLLNFLKQEEAIVADSLLKPLTSPQKQGQQQQSSPSSTDDVAGPSSGGISL